MLQLSATRLAAELAGIGAACWRARGSIGLREERHSGTAWRPWTRFERVHVCMRNVLHLVRGPRLASRRHQAPRAEQFVHRARLARPDKLAIRCIGASPPKRGCRPATISIFAPGKSSDTSSPSAASRWTQFPEPDRLRFIRSPHPDRGSLHPPKPRTGSTAYFCTMLLIAERWQS